MLNKTYPFGATEGEAHFSPVASALSAVRTVPLAPTARRAGVSAAVAEIKSPLASTIDLLIAAPAFVNTVLSIAVPSGCYCNFAHWVE